MNQDINLDQESFNKFIEDNYSVVPTIWSMRERLIKYGADVVRQDVESKMPKSKELKDNIGRLPGEGTKITNRINQFPVAEHALFYLLYIKDFGIVGVELDFNEYKLHWGIVIYSVPGLENIAKDRISDEFSKDNSTSARGKDSLREYAKKVGVIDESDPYQQAMIKEQNEAQEELTKIQRAKKRNRNKEIKEDTVLPIAHFLPTGNRENDSNMIVAKLTDIISRLVNGKPLQLNVEKQEHRNTSYPWKDLFDGYEAKYLLKSPETIKTFLEVAGIAHKENYISNVLAFLLDETEPHPFGDVFFHALNSLYNEKKEKNYQANQDVDVHHVHREYATENNKRIDILIETDKHVMVIENKIYATLYNDLKAYKTAAEELAQPNDDREERDVICIVLNPFGLSKEDQETAGSNEFVSITYKELFDRVTNYFHKVNVYHKDKHFLYVQLFYDLFRTIENLTEGNTQAEDFSSFIKDNSRGYWVRGAILNFIDFRNDVLKGSEEKVKSKWDDSKQCFFWNWYEDKEYGKARGFIGELYACRIKDYMKNKSLVYEMQSHKIKHIKSRSVAINACFDYKNCKWQIIILIRNNRDGKAQVSSVQDQINESGVLKGINGWKGRIDSNVYFIELDRQGNKEADTELIARMYIEIISKFRA